MTQRSHLPRFHRISHYSASSSRAQRASARQLAVPDTSFAQDGIAVSALAPDSDSIPVPMDDDDVMMISRSNSVPNGDVPPMLETLQNGDDDSSASTTKRPRRDKGKGKEKEGAVRVKEEPGAISLNLHDSAPAVVSQATLVYYRHSETYCFLVERRPLLFLSLSGFPGVLRQLSKSVSSHVFESPHRRQRASE